MQLPWNVERSSSHGSTSYGQHILHLNTCLACRSNQNYVITKCKQTRRAHPADIVILSKFWAACPVGAIRSFWNFIAIPNLQCLK